MEGFYHRIDPLSLEITEKKTKNPLARADGMHSWEPGKRKKKREMRERGRAYRLHRMIRPRRKKKKRFRVTLILPSNRTTSLRGEKKRREGERMTTITRLVPLDLRSRELGVPRRREG